MNTKYIPINKGNYSMDTAEREKLFDEYRGWDGKKSMQSIERTGPNTPELKQYPTILYSLTLSYLQYAI